MKNLPIQVVGRCKGIVLFQEEKGWNNEHHDGSCIHATSDHFSRRDAIYRTSKNELVCGPGNLLPKVSKQKHTKEHDADNPRNDERSMESA